MLKAVGRSAASNPRVRGFAKQAVLATAAAIKRRRTRRIQSGRRVAGWRVRNAMLRRGISLPIPAPPNSGLNVSAVPVSVGAGFTATNMGSQRITRREAQYDLQGSVGFYATLPAECMITPSNKGLFPSLATIATQSNYFRFNSITVQYIPASSSNQAGKVGIGFCSNWAAAVLASGSWSNFMGTQGVTTGNAWSPITAVADANMLNTQFLKQGYEVRDMTDIAIADQNCYQGFLMVAVSGNGGTAVMGQVTVSYNVTLIKPKMDPEPASSYNCAWFSAISTNFPCAETYTKGGNKFAKDYFTWSDQGVAGQEYCSSTWHTPYLITMDIQAAAPPSSVSIIQQNVGGTASCTVDAVKQIASTDGTHRYYVVKITPLSLQTHLFKVTSTNISILEMRIDACKSRVSPTWY